MNSPGFSNRGQTKNNSCIINEKNTKTEYESDTSKIINDYFYDIIAEDISDLEITATEPINYYINNKQTTGINTSPSSPQNQPSPKSLDQNEIADLREELERVKRDLKSQQNYTEALARQVVGSDCSLDTVYSDESVENVHIYFKDVEHMNEELFPSFADSEDFKLNEPLKEDFNDVKQIMTTDSDQPLKENLNNKDNSKNQQKYDTPTLKQSQGNNLIVKTPRTSCVEKPTPQSKVLGTPKTIRRAYTPKDKISSDIHKKYTPTLKQTQNDSSKVHTPRRSTPYVAKPAPQSKGPATPKTVRRAPTLSKTIANTTQAKQGTSRITTMQSKVKSKCVATTTPTSGPYSSPLAYKNKQPQNQKIPTTPKTEIICLQKTAKTNRTASISKPAHYPNSRTLNKSKTNTTQPKQRISSANATCSISPKSPPHFTSTSKKKIEFKPTPYNPKTTIACPQKSPTKFKPVTTPVPPKYARTPNKTKTNSTQVKSEISGANCKRQGMRDKCKNIETPRSQSYSPPQKPQCKTTPPNPNNTTVPTQEFVPERKAENILTSPAKISTTCTSRSEISTACTSHSEISTTNTTSSMIISEGKVPRYPTTYVRSTNNASEISTIIPTRSVTTNEVKVARSPTHYPRGTYNPSEYKELSFFGGKQISQSDIVHSNTHFHTTPVESKTELDKSHNENLNPNASDKVNTGSSFCVHCLNNSKTVIKNFLVDELQKIIGNHQTTNIILTTTLQKNGLYHINISLKPNGDHLGCLYTDKQSIIEAGREDELKHYLNLFVASDPNTIDEHHIQFASYKT